MTEKHYWGWPVACYLFLGGLGGGMTVLAAVFDLFMDEGEVFTLALFAAAVLVGLGCFFLIFELGRPMAFWRVFSRQKAVMTFGAWVLLILMFVNVVSVSFLTGWFPWSDVGGLQRAVAMLDLALGVAVVVYTGVLLSSMKARAFWNTPALPALFLVSGLSTGAAADALLAGLWPFDGLKATTTEATEALHSVDAVLLVFEVGVILLYVVLMYTSSSPTARSSAARWLKGAYAGPFWGGVVVAGLLAPLTLYAASGAVALVLAPVLVIVGGVVVRFLVVYSDDRRLFEGEQRYWERLPRGDEAFLKAWE